jgi:hypothetical protein
MARNLYFSEKIRSEMELYESLVIEALKIYGQDLYYLPRELVNEDMLLGDDVSSRFPSSHKIEMYIENIEGFDGEGDLFTRFGVEIRDEVTLVVSKQRFKTQVMRTANAIQSDRPLEGDLIYIPLTNKIFQIQHVEHEQPFYQIENLPVYKMRCTLFEYNNEDFDTGIQGIQNVEKDYSYQYKVCTIAPKKPTTVVTIGEGSVLTTAISNGGTYYTYPPAVNFIGGDPTDSATATTIIDPATGAVTGVTITSGGSGYQSAPILQFVGGSSIDSSYQIGDTVRQTFSDGTIITGEIVRYTLDSAGEPERCFYLTHVGANDGKHHTFLTGLDLINISETPISMNGLKVSSVTELNNLSATEQNDVFTTNYIDNFIDFSEDNPFGDPENQ